jgi:hypothetical protein
MSDDFVESTDNDPFDLGLDPDIEEIEGVDYGNPRVAVIRTSDRGGFKRCRRRWGWQSHLRGNLTTIEGVAPLWFGSGIHFALEDYHGYKNYPHPIKAFEDYVKATYKQEKLTGKRLPMNWPDLVVLGRGMLSYYVDTWLVARDPLKTFVVDGRPQVEVNALVKVPFQNEFYDEVYYAVTLDRVVEGDDGDLYIVDYKTAQRIQTQFFQTDPQISAYCWIASRLYPGRRIGGFIYQQHRKDVPAAPRVLGDGTISISRSQLTTHRHYRKALINIYGEVEAAPSQNVEFLNWLNEIETPSQDRYIRRDTIYRNEHQVEAEGVKLLLELDEMLNRNLPLYPTPTRECGNMCSFNSACVSMDDGGDWESELRFGFRPKEANFDSWRQYLPTVQHNNRVIIP